MLGTLIGQAFSDLRPSPLRSHNGHVQDTGRAVSSNHLMNDTPVHIGQPAIDPIVSYA